MKLKEIKETPYIIATEKGQQAKLLLGNQIILEGNEKYLKEEVEKRGYELLINSMFAVCKFYSEHETTRKETKQ